MFIKDYCVLQGLSFKRVVIIGISTYNHYLSNEEMVESIDIEDFTIDDQIPLNVISLVRLLRFGMRGWALHILVKQGIYVLVFKSCCHKYNENICGLPSYIWPKDT